MEGIDEKELLAFIKKGLEEDLGGQGDYTSMASIPESQSNKAEFLMKDVGVVSGLAFANAVFRYLDTEMEFDALVDDGSSVSYGDIIATVKGNTRAILLAERLILNTMQRLSGTSSLCRKFAEAVEHTPARILDTRKTTPGMRFLEKWAVRKGGCFNYRTGLYDWIMLKDNHINASGGITNAVNRVHGFLLARDIERDITVEVQSIEELSELMELTGVRRVMLDNFKLADMRTAVSLVNGKMETEASGGVNINTVKDIAETGVDYISVGALTHSAPILDISLNFTEK